GQHVAPEADTSDLSRFDFGRPPGDTELSPRREMRERLRRRGLFGVLALLFGIAFIVTTIVSYVVSHSAAKAPESYPVPSPIKPGDSEPPNANPVPPPDSAGGRSSVSPERAARLYAFREALNMQGYTNVHFKIDGDTMVLWGTVPSLDDKTWVEELVP